VAAWGKAYIPLHDAQPQDSQPPYSPSHPPPGDLDLPLHPHPIVEPGPQLPQVEPIPTQTDTVPKVSAIRREVRRVFQEEDDEAWAARVSEYTMQELFFALLQAENESITWKSYIWNLPRGVLKFAVSLVCSFAIFQIRNDPFWFSRLVMRHIDGVPTGE
jgi:hypothetical protein